METTPKSYNITFLRKTVSQERSEILKKAYNVRFKKSLLSVSLVY